MMSLFTHCHDVNYLL